MSIEIKKNLDKLNDWFKNLIVHHYLCKKTPLFLFAGNVYDMCSIPCMYYKKRVEDLSYDTFLKKVDGNNIIIGVVFKKVLFEDNSVWKEKVYELFGHLRWIKFEHCKDLPSVYKLEKIFNVDDLTTVDCVNVGSLENEIKGELIMVVTDITEVHGHEK